MAKVAWIKFREKWNTGPDDWEYMRFSWSTDLREEADEYFNEKEHGMYHEYGDGYRGIEHIVLLSTPEDELVKLVDETRLKLFNITKYYYELIAEQKALHVE